MGFQLGNIADTKEAGNIQGIQREIACDCWFTSSGKTIPQSIKVMDEEGVLHTIKEIKVLFSEEKTFSGIQMVEHICKIIIGGREETVKLIFRCADCKWVLVQA